MKKAEGRNKKLIELAIGIVFTVLTTIFNLVSPNPSPVPFLSAHAILPRIVTGLPFLGLLFCFLEWKDLGNSIRISRGQLFFGELYILFWGFLISLFFINYMWDPAFVLIQCFFLAVVLLGSSFIKVGKKSVVTVLVISSIVSLFLSYIAYPYYKSAQVFYYILPIPNLHISFFYVLILESSILSLLFAYSWMSYMDSLLTEFLKRPPVTFSKTKYFAVHFEIIPIILSPLAILQMLGKTEFLVPMTLLIFGLCYTKIITVVTCPIIAVLGKHVLSIRVLGITTLWALIPFVQYLLVVFHFVSLNLGAGSYAFVLIISSLFASVLGIALSRIQ